VKGFGFHSVSLCQRCNHKLEMCIDSQSEPLSSAEMRLKMEFLNIVKSRYSVRSYVDKKVEKDKLDKILEAAHVAPTAANLQPVHLLVVQEKKGLDKIGKAANIYNAPLAIIICSDHLKAWKRPFDGKQTIDIDASIVTDHMMLEATELGLGTVWICYFKPDVIRKEFALPDNLEPINILAAGYSDEQPASPERHLNQRIPLNDLVSYEKL
jgi:nitroreductase